MSDQQQSLVTGLMDSRQEEGVLKPIQLFNAEYVERCAAMTPLQIARFLDDFRRVHAPVGEHKTSSKLISMRVPEDLLFAFKTQAQLQGRPYQAVIKELMRKWLIESGQQFTNP